MTAPFYIYVFSIDFFFGIYVNALLNGSILTVYQTGPANGAVPTL
jgi:hypothetical protein